MVAQIHSISLEKKFDLAGYCHTKPRYLQTRSRINYLVERYLSLDILSDRLLDLPQQFENPKQRPWGKINWTMINEEQIVGVDKMLFLGVIIAAAEIETPIRGYSQESWRYLEKIHPQMAKFMGGKQDENGKLIEVGLWEKEERQHAPAFRKIYQQLTGEKMNPKPHGAKSSFPLENPQAELYRHAVNRIATEWSATSLYLWLMAHSTGALQQAIAQPLQDEVNHLAKFWGIARWGFSDSTVMRIARTSRHIIDLLFEHQGERSSSNDILQLNHSYSALEIGFTFLRVIRQMYRWNSHLQSDALAELFGDKVVKL